MSVVAEIRVLLGNVVCALGHQVSDLPSHSLIFLRRCFPQSPHVTIILLAITAVLILSRNLFLVTDADVLFLPELVVQSAVPGQAIGFSLGFCQQSLLLLTSLGFSLCRLLLRVVRLLLLWTAA